MRFFKLESVNTCFWTLFCLLGMHIAQAQVNGVFVVEKDQEHMFRDSILEVDQLIIKGTFKLEDTKDVKLKFSKLLIDGGRFVAGSSENPFGHQLLLEFASELASFEVINGGNLYVFGGTRNEFTTENPRTDKNSHQKEYESNIHFFVKNTSQGYMAFRNAEDIHISGVQFSGLGSNDNSAISIADLIQKGSFLKHCLFRKSQNTDLELTNSTLEVTENLISSEAATSIKSYNSGVASPSVFRNNHIYNMAGKGSYAVLLENSGHLFENNTVLVENNTNGIGILFKEKAVAQRERPTQDLNFHNNHIINLSKKNTQTTIGLEVDHFDSKGIQKSNGNSIENFEIGAVLKNPGFLVSNYKFIDNTIGCVPGKSYLEQIRFVMENPDLGKKSTAIWVTDSYSGSAPKINGITIQNYDLGFHFEGLVSASNYFREIQYDERTRPMFFSAIDAKTIIHTQDGSLMGRKNTTQNSPRQKTQGHHGHHTAKAKINICSGFVVYPKQSFLNHSESKTLAANDGVNYSPISKFGKLTIATGMGLTDPVHEHDGAFDGVKILNRKGTVITFNEKTNTYELEVIADEYYELDFGSFDLPFYDYGFEWEAPSGKSIYLKLPYPHPSPVAMRSFGNQLYAVESREALTDSENSSFYWDKPNGTVYLKMVAQSNFEEMVIYSNEVLTEINVEGSKIPLTIKTDPSVDKIYFEYTLPKPGCYSKLEVLDYYGNVVERVYHGFLDQETNRAEINLKNYDFKNNVYRYALTVGDKVHRGPVYIY